MAKKTELVEEDFNLVDDESIIDEEVKVIKKAKKAVKKSKSSKKVVGHDTQVVSVRLPSELVDAINNSDIKMSDAFKAFCEKEIIHSTKCPTCGQHRNKK